MLFLKIAVHKRLDKCYIMIADTVAIGCVD